jgi:hypothetical protein
MGNIKTSNEMTSKEKAKELVYKFDNCMEFSTPQRFAKQCALVAVDEILNTIEYSSQADELSKISYWTQVKNEINKL